MKFCCESFEGSYFIGNQCGINIRIVKFNSEFLISKGNLYFKRNRQINKTSNKRNDVRFFMTMGYEKFRLDLPMANIGFCPFCGTNLYDYYVEDEYFNEIEGKTFNL